jgi:hypothetical protein
MWQFLFYFFDSKKVAKNCAGAIKAKIVGARVKFRFAKIFNALALRRFLHAFSRLGVPSPFEAIRGFVAKRTSALQSKVGREQPSDAEDCSRVARTPPAGRGPKGGDRKTH